MAKRSLKPWHATVRRINKKLASLPVELAQGIAQGAAVDFTIFAHDDLNSGKTAYGEPRPRSVDGGELTLKRTQATARSLEFRALGTVVRARLDTSYAPYLIGRYGILPNGRIPSRWSSKIRELVSNAEAESRR